MEDLEEIIDMFDSCKVECNKEEVYYYLCEEIGKISEIPDDEVEKFRIVYNSIRDVLIDTYCSAMKMYYRHDRPMGLTIDREGKRLRLSTK
jgi:hypothetical protein